MVVVVEEAFGHHKFKAKLGDKAFHGQIMAAQWYEEVAKMLGVAIHAHNGGGWWCFLAFPRGGWRRWWSVWTKGRDSVKRREKRENEIFE